MHLDFSIQLLIFIWRLLNKGPNKFKNTCNLKYIYSIYQRQILKKEFDSPLGTFILVLTRSPRDLSNTNNHMSGPMWSCNLHTKYKLLFSYLRKHAKYSVFIIIVNLQNEKPNYNRKKKILVWGKMNLVITQVGRLISVSHNQWNIIIY